MLTVDELFSRLAVHLSLVESVHPAVWSYTACIIIPPDDLPSNGPTSTSTKDFQQRQDSSRLYEVIMKTLAMSDDPCSLPRHSPDPRENLIGSYWQRKYGLYGILLPRERFHTSVLAEISYPGFFRSRQGYPTHNHLHLSP